MTDTDLLLTNLQHTIDSVMFTDSHAVVDSGGVNLQAHSSKGCFKGSSVLQQTGSRSCHAEVQALQVIACSFHAGATFQQHKRCNV